MENETYLTTISGLSAILGSTKSLTSGNGTRFTSATKGKATVYHKNISVGNQVEIAFHSASMAHRLGVKESDFCTLVETWKNQTGRSVQLNKKHMWPRVGISSAEQAEALITLLRSITS